MERFRRDVDRHREVAVEADAAVVAFETYVEFVAVIAYSDIFHDVIGCLYRGFGFRAGCVDYTDACRNRYFVEIADADFAFDDVVAAFDGFCRAGGDHRA